jgi:DNA-binding transcriptional ArsR family regulator
MAAEARKHITEPDALEALAHPVRLEIINFLMANGPATASTCARAVGDSPSNCSYHLRTLAKFGLVGEAPSGDGRERPWQALITGFDTDPEQMSPQAAKLLAVSVQRDQKITRDYLAIRDQQPEQWRAADGYATYTLRMTPAELDELGAQLDALIRPYISATRGASPEGAELVHLGVHAFPLVSDAKNETPKNETPKDKNETTNGGNA